MTTPYQMKWLRIFMEKAIYAADKYVTHAGRTVITKTDIKLGLKSETFKFLKRENFIDDVKKWQEIIAEEEEDVEDLIELESIVSNSTYVKFTKSECTCETCKCFNGIEDKWDEWTPQNQIEIILKNAVLKIN